MPAALGLGYIGQDWPLASNYFQCLTAHNLLPTQHANASCGIRDFIISTPQDILCWCWGQLFYGHNFYHLLVNATNRTEGTTAYNVDDPERDGLAEFDIAGKGLSRWKKSLHNLKPTMLSPTFIPIIGKLLTLLKHLNLRPEANLRLPASIKCTWRKAIFILKLWGAAMHGWSWHHESLLHAS